MVIDVEHDSDQLGVAAMCREDAAQGFEAVLRAEVARADQAQERTGSANLTILNPNSFAAVPQACSAASSPEQVAT
jgi:hypothetical protein